MSSNGQEDHVSMGANAATKLLRVVENTKLVLAMEWLCAVNASQQRSSATATVLQQRVEQFLAQTDLSHRSIPMNKLTEAAYAYCWDA
jgi:histidine ammonia-lyase